MTVPGIVESRLGDESVAARISLSGGDGVFVTPTRTLVYRGEGLLSDESVESFDHDVDRLSVSEGRRKSKVVYEDAVEGSREFSVPASRLTEVVEPILAGVLRARGVTDSDERIAGAYRFSELTLVITSERLLKHVGGAVWDDEYESFHFEDVTRLEYEEGSVATQIVMDVDGRTQRIKTPNDEFAAVREQLDSAVFAYHDVGSAAELAEKVAPDDEDDESEERVDATDAVVSMGEGIDPLSTGGSDAEAGGGEADVPGPDPADETDAGVDEGDAGDSDVEENVDGSGTAESEDDDDGESEDDDGGIQDEADSADTEAIDRETDDEGASGEEVVGEETGSDGVEPDEIDDEGASGDDGGATTEPGDDDAPVDAEDADETVIEEWESPPDESGSFGGGFEPASGESSQSVAEELAALRETVERQNELLAKHQQTIEQLVVALQDRAADDEDTS